MSDQEEGFGFAPEHDAPIPYMQRIRDYYQALGYGAPYRWAHYAEAPFTPLKKPLAESRVGLITTAAPYQPDKGDQGPGAPYNGAAKFYRVYSGETDRDHDVLGVADARVAPDALVEPKPHEDQQPDADQQRQQREL